MMDFLNFEAFLETLPVMGLGMLGIFLVTIVIILTMVILALISKN